MTAAPVDVEGLIERLSRPSSQHCDCETCKRVYEAAAMLRSQADALEAAEEAERVFINMRDDLMIQLASAKAEVERLRGELEGAANSFNYIVGAAIKQDVRAALVRATRALDLTRAALKEPPL